MGAFKIPPTQKVYNSEGKLITLAEGREKRIANSLQRYCNDLGYEINITTLTTVLKKITDQSFYEIAFADYVPVVIGEGAWSDFLTTYRQFAIADDFATGVINTADNNARLAQANTGIDAVTNPVINWAKEINWTIPQLEQASRSGNWDLITGLEESRKTNWDLGLQKIAFLGLAGTSNILGLLNQTGVTNDTLTLTSPISNLSTADLKTFCSVILNVYRANNFRTAWPTAFIMPESDYLGLAAPASSDFPIRSTLSLLEETFQVMTKNKSFKILPCAYGDKANNTLGVQRYALTNQNEKSIRMNIPVDYTNTLANSMNNFQFANVGYGQFTGVVALKPAELYYLSF